MTFNYEEINMASILKYVNNKEIVHIKPFIKSLEVLFNIWSFFDPVNMKGNKKTKAGLHLYTQPNNKQKDYSHPKMALLLQKS